MKRKAVYAFSGDPITFGHIHIIERAGRAFDEIIVAIGKNPDKRYLFTLEERVSLARQALAHLSYVRVTPFSGLLVDYASEVGARFIIKGIRIAGDFDYENILFQVGESQKAGVDTLLLLSKAAYAHISSSTVKSIQMEQGFIQEYVPLPVKRALEHKLSKQTLVGITGEIASGKSFLASALVSFASERNMTAHHVDLDQVARDILETLPDPIYRKTRQAVAKRFGNQVLTKNGFIDRKKLGTAIFRDDKELSAFNQIMEKPVLLRLKRVLYGKEGLIVLESSLLMEAGLHPLCNNHIILVRTSKALQKNRLEERSLTPDQIKSRLSGPYNFQSKRTWIEDAIKETGSGSCWVIENGADEIDRANQPLFSEILDTLTKPLLEKNKQKLGSATQG